MTTGEPTIILFLLVFGLLQLFFGYAVFRILIVTAGAIAGFLYGPQLLANLTPGPVAPWAVVLVSLLSDDEVRAIAAYVFAISQP